MADPRWRLTGRSNAVRRPHPLTWPGDHPRRDHADGEIFIDTASGKLASRPQLEKALLSASRAGDQLVVTKLDRLGRSLEHLIELSKHLEERGVDLVVLDQRDRHLDNPQLLTIALLRRPERARGPAKPGTDHQS